MITMVTNKETVKHANGPSRKSINGTNSSRVKSMPPLTLYRPPAARNESQGHHLQQQSPLVTQNNHVASVSPVNSRLSTSFQSSQPASQTKKIRRPDQLMYIPRPRRSETGQKISNQKHNHSEIMIKKNLSLSPVTFPGVVQSDDDCHTSSPVMSSESISSRGMVKLKLNESSCDEMNDTLQLKDNPEIDSLNNSHHSSYRSSSESLEEVQKDISRQNSLIDMNSSSISSDELNGSGQISKIHFGHHRSSLNLNDSVSNDMSNVDLQEVKKHFDPLYNSSTAELNDSIPSVPQNDENDNSNSNYSTDSSFTKLESSVNCDTEIISCHDSNDKKLNSEDVTLKLSSKINCKNEEKDISPTKRKEICESESNEDGFDHKSKQIHLIDDSGIEETLSYSDYSTNLNESFDVLTSSSDENIIPDKTPKAVVEDQNSSKLNLDDCDWESLFDDEGNCLEPLLLDELSESVGKVKVTSAPSDYRSFQTTEERTNDGECIVEIYGFPAEFKTRDLLAILAAFRNRAGFQIKWVDDTHALGVFNSPLVADELLQCELPFVKTRPLRLALPESRNKARTIPIALPPTSRPKTCPALAKRLVTGALGLRLPTDRKKREEERLILKEARDKRRLAAKQREAAWEGKIGNNEVSS